MLPLPLISHNKMVLSLEINLGTLINDKLNQVVSTLKWVLYHKDIIGTFLRENAWKVIMATPSRQRLHKVKNTCACKWIPSLALFITFPLSRWSSPLQSLVTEECCEWLTTGLKFLNSSASASCCFREAIVSCWLSHSQIW